MVCVFACVFLLNCSDTHVLRIGITCAVLMTHQLRVLMTQFQNVIESIRNFANQLEDIRYVVLTDIFLIFVLKISQYLNIFVIYLLKGPYLNNVKL